MSVDPPLFPLDRAPGSPGRLADLVERVASGRDRAAFMELFDHYAPRLKAFLRRRGAGDAQAEDLVQDVMLTVWQRAVQYDRRQASVSTWVFTIARNRQIDVLRRERRPELDADEPLLLPSAAPEPDRLFDAEQSAERVRAALALLPEEQAELVRVSFYEEASHSALAERFGLPLGTVKSRLRLALQKLRHALEVERPG
ncbi:MAG: sigma-70 family RNA polymerase sigma factor [Geminicoccaceae bacterium]|nr:MAG: sigma-70 family RNA polymerase sigma factor [Geminicoccaceae bacterium]